MPYLMGPICHIPVRMNIPFGPFRFSKVRGFTLPKDPLASRDSSSIMQGHWRVPHVWSKQMIWTLSSIGIPTNEWSYWWLCILGLISFNVFSTHMSLYGNNLHTTSKDPTTCSYLPHMRREALRFWSLNPKSSLQGKLLRSRDLSQLYTTI